jgi:PhnO protein
MEKQNIIIRSAISDDMLTVYEQICELEEITLDLNTFKNIFFNNINQNNNLYYVAEESTGLCLGFISCHVQALLHHGGKVAEIQELFVQPHYRNQGIGNMLIKHIESLLKEMGCVSFEVTAQNKRIRTHEFYKKENFIASHIKFTKTL